MIQKSTIKPLAFALGAAFATGLSVPAVVNAADNPFAMTEMSSGYLVTAAVEGKCGGNKANAKSDAEARCGANRTGDKTAKEGKCGEGKCGSNKAAKKAAKEGKCGGSKASHKATTEGKCGGNK